MSHSSGVKDRTVGNMLVSSRTDCHACFPMIAIMLLRSRDTSASFLLPLFMTCSSVEAEVEVDAAVDRGGSFARSSCSSDAIAGVLAGWSMSADAGRPDRAVDVGRATGWSKSAVAERAARLYLDADAVRAAWCRVSAVAERAARLDVVSAVAERAARLDVGTVAVRAVDRVTGMT